MNRRKFIRTGALFLPATGLAQVYLPRRRAVNQTAAAPAATYLVEENCEGTGTPSGWTDANAPDWDYTSTVLRGSQSLGLTASNPVRSSYSASFTATGTCWMHVMFRYGAGSPNDTVLSLRSGTTNCASLVMTSSTRIYTYHGSVGANLNDWSSGTTYHVWMKYVKSPGSYEGILDLYRSTTTTRGSPVLSITTGSRTLDVDNILLSGSTAIDIIFDYVLVDDAEIGDVST